jgi:anthranilate synthase component 1
MLTRAEFTDLAAQGHTRIPLVREVHADLDTPLSIYLKLVDGPYAYLFESVQGGETWGRYSIIGLPAMRTWTVHGRTWRAFELGVLVDEREVEDPLAEVARLQASYTVPTLPELPGFAGGLVGYFGFETIGYIEPGLARRDKPDQLGTPDILLMESSALAVFDRLKGTLALIVHANPDGRHAYERAARRLEQLEHRLRGSGPAYPEVLDPAAIDEAHFVSTFSRGDFEAAVRRCQAYILAGDIFQVVLSQRLSVPFRARPIDVYRALRAMNPSPYMYFLDLDGTHVVGSSPEILVRLSGDAITLRPIAGTRPRGATPEADQALAEDLLADPKELAEHVMLMDLGRNDVGRVAVPGSVVVPERMVIERYSHVMHIVSQVEGRLRPGLSAIDVLRATFPAGTVSGAPKVRALEIIEELEPIRRNVYAGAVGWLGWHGDADLAIAIRTAVIQDGMLHVQAGAGIVADSDPGREWEETMSKGRALFRAVAQAASGL